MGSHRGLHCTTVAGGGGEGGKVTDFPKKKTLGRRRKCFFFCSPFKFLLCAWPALRMMLMNFYCYETKTFYMARFFAKQIDT